MSIDRRNRVVGKRGVVRNLRPILERMESRQLLATIVVTGTGDTIAADGIVTLREAITAANTNAASGDAAAGSAGLDTIAFNIPGAGAHTITLTGSLPAIVEPIVIDGTTQPGSSANTLAVGDNAVLNVVLDGSQITFNSSGLLLAGGSSGSTIRGLVINRFAGDIGASAIELRGSSGNTIVGNFLGTDAAGTAAMGNGVGIRVLGGGNRIGTAAPADRNVISGNVRNGVSLQDDAVAANSVQGNYIGVDVTGNAGLGNGTAGIFLQGVFQGTTQGAAVIGGPTATPGTGAGNVISGNSFFGGISVNNADLSDLGPVTIQGNLVGLGVDGTTARGNVGGGITISASIGSTNGAILIGGPTASTRNVISANIGDSNTQGGDGITYYDATATVQGNYIGTDTTGTLPRGNSGFGIDLLGDRRDPNNSAATAMTIGGTAAGQGNLISANVLGGISIRNANTVIQGNRIGTQADGTSALGNTDEGVKVYSVEGPSPFMISIGGLADGAGNVIANNGVGVSAAAAGVTILRNSFFGNRGKGIVVSSFAFAATPASPVLTGATGTRITGTASGPIGTVLRLEFFATPNEADQGKTFLGTRDVTIDGAGFTFDPVGGVPAGQLITATATNATGTSAFSARIGTPTTLAADLAVTATNTPNPVAAGSNLSYAIVVTDNGPDPAQGVRLSTAVPAGTIFVSFTTPAGWSATTPAVGGTGALSATTTGVAAGGAGAGSFTLVVRVDPGAANGSIVGLTAQVASTTADPVAANNTATASATVVAASPTNTPPAAVADAYPATAGVALTVPARGLLANDTDPQGIPLAAVLETGPAHGALALRGDGSFTYTPDAGFSGVDSFTYRASDGLLSSAPATVTITVAAPTPVPGTTGPRVVGLRRLGFHDQATQLFVVFDKALAQAGATALSSYRLTSAGPDGRFGTRDDVTIALRAATYDGETATVRLVTRRPLPLRHNYRLTISGLRDLAGNRLDGDTVVLAVNRSILAGPSAVAAAAGHRPVAAVAGHRPVATVARRLNRHASSR